MITKDITMMSYSIFCPKWSNKIQKREWNWLAFL